MAMIMDRCRLGAFDLSSVDNIRSHSPSAALLCAKMSNIVYLIKDSANPRGVDWIPDQQLREDPDTREGLPPTEFPRFVENGVERNDSFFTSVPGGAALGLKRKDTIVVAFRGTSNGDGWRINLHGAGIGGPAVLRYSVGFSKTTDALVHAGFQSVANALALAIEKPLREFLERTSHPKVLFCGHSLGGALALLAGQGASGYLRNIQSHIENVDAIYSFGAPKVGNNQLGQLLNRVHFRYTLKGDPVPRVPPSSDFVHNIPSIDLDPYKLGTPPSIYAKIKRGYQRGIGILDGTAQAAVELLAAEHDIGLYVKTINSMAHP